MGCEGVEVGTVGGEGSFYSHLRQWAVAPDLMGALEKR